MDPSRFILRRPFHPILALSVSFFVITAGLIVDATVLKACLIGGVVLLYLIAGYHRPWIFIVRFAVPLALIISGTAYLVGRNFVSSLNSFFIILVLTHAAVPVLAMDPLSLSRVLVQLGTPRAVSLGLLVSVRFIPVLRSEMSRVREAIIARGIRFHWTNWGHLYRAFFIPFTARLIDLSDILALSMETRGYGAHCEATVYRPVRWSKKDILGFVALFLLLGGLFVAALFLPEVR
jgi:energy-coupling factor transport system permease protein